MAWICSFLQSQCVKSKKARLCHQKTIHEIEKKCEICGEVCIDQNILQIHKDNLHSIENSHENFDIDTQIENSTQAQLYHSENVELF